MNDRHSMSTKLIRWSWFIAYLGWRGTPWTSCQFTQRQTVHSLQAVCVLAFLPSKCQAEETKTVNVWLSERVELIPLKYFILPGKCQIHGGHFKDRGAALWHTLSFHETKQAKLLWQVGSTGAAEEMRPTYPQRLKRTHTHTRAHCLCLISSQRAECRTLLSNKGSFTTICNLFLSLSRHQSVSSPPHPCLFSIPILRIYFFSPPNSDIVLIRLSPIHCLWSPALSRLSFSAQMRLS